ncbi:uncharacterized protein [Coffea arabica]|uniref:RNase H type-1 domain-containing protein n=1 Tax=Coffea arabica TaxID=13443 RepID=A0ABM4VMA3_COFAR
MALEKHAQEGELLQKGLWKRVGDGRSVRIWHDRWIPGLVDGRVHTAKPVGCQLEFVNELIEGGKWNIDLLQHWFHVDVVNHITNIPHSLYDRKDRLFWNFSKSGIYTMKTGYVIAKEEKEKTNQRLAPDLKTTQVIWKIAPVRWEGLAKLQGNLWRWWEAVLQAVKETQADAKVIVDKAQQEWIKYEAAKESDIGTNSAPEKATPVQQHWEPPKEGTIRINTDAAISTKMVRSGPGIIARNWRGELVRAKGITARRNGIAATEEALAIRGALEMAQFTGWTNIEVQFDCKHVVSLINTDNVQECSLQTILEDIDIQKKNFESCIFTFVPRTVNQCSHELAQFAAKATRSFEWEGSFPTWLSRLVRKDIGVVTPFCN